MDDSTTVAIVAIISLTIIEVAAISQGINSVLMGIIVAAISGLGGYKLRKVLEKVMS